MDLLSRGSECDSGHGTVLVREERQNKGRMLEEFGTGLFVSVVISRW